MVCFRIIYIQVNKNLPFVTMGFQYISQVKKDLEAEKWGVERVEAFAAILDACILPHNTVIENVRFLWDALQSPDMVSQDCGAAASAFLDDMASVL